MITQWLLSLLSLSLLFAPFVGLPQTKSYDAERFDVAITIESDGTLLVTETLVFRFTGGPFTYAFRNLPTEKTDGIEVVSASFDGVMLPRGEDAGQVEVEGEDPLAITWHFAPTSDSTHTLGLTYRVRGVMFQDSGSDLLRWQALPEAHDYTIARSRVVVTYLTAASLLDSRVTYGSAQVEGDSSEVTFTTQDLGADEFFVFELRFAPGSLVSTAPQWQVAQEQTQALRAGWGRWALPSAGAALLIFGLGLAAVVTYQKRFQAPAGAESFTANRPPSDRLPAFAGVLAQQGSLQYGWDYALGSLFQLAQRGLVSIEERATNTWFRKHTYVLRLNTLPAHLDPHEQAVIQVFFGTKQGLAQEMPVHTLQNSLQRRVKFFTDELKKEITGLGFFDAERQRGRNILFGWGWVLILLSPALAVAGLLLLMRSAIGPWPVLIAASMFFVGFVAMILGATTPTLSDGWINESASWVAFKKYLRNVTKGRESLAYAAGFSEYLPYAAALGLADVWATYLKRHEDFEIPAWFTGLNATASGSHAGFIVMIAAINASGASSGASASAAGAAAGAAGGGASGAG
ncbi:MAG: hypothetical protein BWY63_01786 [Chloroflexi bacterium ADurb.Bin360]|nr:MAG: hypothetical protein BWY63_01786 [Chloroflexi bacterium ADurb.Bin360]